MAHKSKSRGKVHTEAAAPLTVRIARARNEERFQQALELSRQLYKLNPCENSLILLREVSFERGEQLLAQGHQKEAAQVFSNIVEMGGPAEFQRTLIEKLAACGAVAEALTLAERLGDAQLRGNVLGFVADHALRHGARSSLPVDLQPQFDAILTAFAQAEAGKDEEVRTTLQAIGLTSPFMEWRILLRGLLAYYANDDVRALENWQRLNPQRMPARLAAPFRFGIDPAYRAAQPPATQNIVRQQLDRLQGSGPLPVLRAIQAQLIQPGKMAQTFRHIEGLLPTLRQQAPDLLPRLAACFRWAVIEEGQPEDIDRFLRVFGPPPDDLHLHRMTALAMEKHGMFVEAHQRWQMFEKEVKAGPAWPGDQPRYVRSLVWAHIGDLAGRDTPESMVEQFLPFAPLRPKNEATFKPAAEECFRKSLELAPDSLPTHQALFHCLLNRPDKGPAMQAGKKLLEHFPDDIDTLRILGTLSVEEGQFEEAKDYLQRALNVNPLERTLRIQLVKLHEMRARLFSCAKRFDDARTALQAALSLYDLPSKFALLCLSAVLELKAKNRQRCDELVAEAEREAGRLTVVFCLLCESIRQKLTPAQKKPFAQEFEAGLSGKIEPVAIPPLIAMLVNQRMSGPAYSGQKTHEKKVLALVEKAPLGEISEAVLEGVCDALLGLEATKALKRCIAHARKNFPGNPQFMLDEADMILRGRGNHYPAQGLLERARRIIEELPRGDNQQMLLERVQELEESLREEGGFHNFISSMMDRMYNMNDDMDRDDEDDEDGFFF